VEVQPSRLASEEDRGRGKVERLESLDRPARRPAALGVLPDNRSAGNLSEIWVQTFNP